jgi:hypothetical protein
MSMLTTRLALLLLAGAGVVGCSASSPPAEAPGSPAHLAAKERFSALAETGFKAPVEELKASLKACFLKGDYVSNYQPLLARAKRNELRPDKGDGEALLDPFKHPKAVYRWWLEDGNDGTTLDVYVGGYPPIIVGVGDTVWLR